VCFCRNPLRCDGACVNYAVGSNLVLAVECRNYYDLRRHRRHIWFLCTLCFFLIIHSFPEAKAKLLCDIALSSVQAVLSPKFSLLLSWPNACDVTISAKTNVDSTPSISHRRMYSLTIRDLRGSKARETDTHPSPPWTAALRHPNLCIHIILTLKRKIAFWNLEDSA
jgi:hypothetical protein